MSKFFKIILMIFILLCFCINSVFAANTTKNTTTTNTTSTNFNDLIPKSNTTNTTSNVTNTQTNTTVITPDDIPEAGLGLTNILNILLITVGVVIIFLAIAILIRLK